MTSAANPSLVCASVTHARCALPDDVMNCPGAALLWPRPKQPRSRQSAEGFAASSTPRIYTRQCITDARRVARALHEHASRARDGIPGLHLLRTGARSLGEAPPLRAAAAIVDATRATPLGRAVDGLLARGAHATVALAGPLVMAFAGFVVLAVRACAVGEWSSRARRARGHRLGRSSWWSWRRRGRARS